MKYTYAFLKPYVESSDSCSDVVRKLGLKSSGGTISYLSKVIAKLGIDTTHFSSQAWRSSPGRRGQIIRRSPESILIVDTDRKSKTKTHLLVRALTEIGRPYMCEICAQPPNWNHQPLTLQIDHINGDVFDNQSTNLRFVCPNCHSQTQTFGIKNSLNVKNKTGVGVNTSYSIAMNPVCFCISCGAGVKKRNGMCKSCAAKNRKTCISRSTKIEWPDYDTLKNMVQEKSYLAVGRDLGVSDNAVRKRLMAKNHQE